MTGSTKITTTEQVEAFLSLYDDFLFDCDGVLWQGSHILPKTKETLEYLRARGKRLIFVTNNSTKSRQEYTEKFESFGITVSKDEVFGSAYSSAVYLSKVLNFPKDKKVLVVGQKGLEEELKEAGIQYIGGTDPALMVTGPCDKQLEKLEYDPSIGAVLCGLDYYINYFKIANALVQIQNPNTLFLATNIDATLPINGNILPGAGTIVGTLITSSGREPISLGKPSQAMMDAIKAKFHFDPRRACMVGDRLNTDIAFGKAGGLGTLLVLTGITKESQLDAASNPVAVPEFYIDKLGSLYEYSHTK